MTVATTSILVHCTAQCRIASPLGTMLLARTETGLAGAWFEKQKHHPDAIDAPERSDDPLLTATARQQHRAERRGDPALRRAVDEDGGGCEGHGVTPREFQRRRRA